MCASDDSMTCEKDSLFILFKNFEFSGQKKHKKKRSETA